MSASRPIYRFEWGALLLGCNMVFGSAAMHCRTGGNAFLGTVALGGYVSIQAIDLLTMPWGRL
jgi:hypothetical protein